MAPTNTHEVVMEIAKRRGLFWPSFKIYGGVSGFYTYGNLGVKLKRNIENTWREYFVRRRGFLELEAPILNSSRVFEASGHLEHFKEYFVECTECGRSYRADHLIEEETGLENVESMGGEEITRLIREHEFKCLDCGGELRQPISFLTMFQTSIGATGGEIGFARPELAQGMFLNFRRGFQQAREKLPFALAQTGKVLRNEISPRRGMLRLREFTIMELELFFDPHRPSCPFLHEVSEEGIKLLTEDMEARDVKEPMELPLCEALEKGYILSEWQAYFMGVSKRFLSHLGIPSSDQRFRAHLPQERSHYSAQTFDHEVKLESWGWIEVAGHAYRTDYDLKAHQRGAGSDMSALRPDGTRIIPHVVEPSFGLDRLVHVVLETSYQRKKKRNILSIPRSLAPIKVVVLPLVTKDGLPQKALEVYRLLMEKGLTVDYDESGSIGRRYARSDEIGTPLAVTIDYDSIKDDTVTIRDRESWSQIRLNIDVLPLMLERYLRGEIGFDKLGF